MSDLLVKQGEGNIEKERRKEGGRRREGGKLSREKN